MKDQNPPLIILGGRTAVGSFFMRRIVATGWKVDAVSRYQFDVPRGINLVKIDLNKSVRWISPSGSVVVSFLPLWVLEAFLPRLNDASAIIAIGSTSLYGKANSEDYHERLVVERLGKAEQKITQWASEKNILWTLLRPTLIYDCQTDKNITRMAHFICRWKFLPIASPAQGLRQPVHADDVAQAVIGCLQNPLTQNKALNIAGAEILSYRMMAERVFVALNQKPRFILLPLGGIQKILRIALWLKLLTSSNLTVSMFSRMNEDLVFDTTEGLTAIKYKPRSFNPEFLNILS